jgi:hypothetical protein
MPPFVLGRSQGRQEHSGEDCDDRDHHQQLDQGKPMLPEAKGTAADGAKRHN